MHIVETHPEATAKRRHVRLLAAVAALAALAALAAAGFLAWSIGGERNDDAIMGSAPVSAPQGGLRAEASPLIAREDESTVRPSGVEALDAAYEACAKALGFDPGFAQVLVVDGRPDLVKTGRDVPARVHGPCLSRIGGKDTGRSSYGYPLP